MAESNTLSERLKECRKKKGVKQSEVADRLNVQRQIISYYESGTRKPNLGDLIMLADFYNVSIDYLVGRTDTPTTDKDLRFICDYTGLTNTSISTLHKRVEVIRGDGYVERDVFDVEMLNFTNKFISEYATALSELAYMYKMNFSSSVWYKQKYLTAETPEEIEKFGREACNKELLCEINTFNFQKLATKMLEKDSDFEKANKEIEKVLAEDKNFALARLLTQTVGVNYGND